VAGSPGPCRAQRIPRASVICPVTIPFDLRTLQRPVDVCFSLRPDVRSSMGGGHDPASSRGQDQPPTKLSPAKCRPPPQRVSRTRSPGIKATPQATAAIVDLAYHSPASRPLRKLLIRYGSSSRNGHCDSSDRPRGTRMRVSDSAQESTSQLPPCTLLRARSIPLSVTQGNSVYSDALPPTPHCARRI